VQAVIGAGAAGMTAVRELRREGHQVDVFEQQANVGGVWVLDENVESDPLGKDPNREVVHSSMYDSLRVNLPRELMGFSDFPFIPQFMQVLVLPVHHCTGPVQCPADNSLLQSTP